MFARARNWVRLVTQQLCLPELTAAGCSYLIERRPLPADTFDNRDDFSGGKMETA
jgi:hypothetical protein